MYLSLYFYLYIFEFTYISIFIWLNSHIFENVAPQKVASCGKKEWPSLCQPRSQQNVTSMDLAPKCVALFPKELDVRITKALEATCWLKAFFAKKTNSLGPFENKKNNSFFQWN